MDLYPDAPSPHFPVRPDWLAQHQEPILEPDLPIVDAHHHLWDRNGQPYFFFDFLEDLRAGHAVEASVFMECGAMYRARAVPELRSLGETEFANGAAALSASDRYGSCRVCAGIVAHVDLRLGDRVEAVLQRHMAAAGERFCGIRQISAWHPDPTARGSMASPPAELLSDPRFRNGFAALERLGLSFDAWMYHTQLGEAAALAQDFPATTIILDHAGGALGIGPYAGKRQAVFAEWRAGMAVLARCPNVCVKLGGLGMRMSGFDFGSRPRPPSSQEVAAVWRPYIETCIELLGPERCMFESNFPVDKGSCSYAVLWNAFKRITSGASSDEKEALYRGTATRVYRLDRSL
jgi:predicted TIM-barrel fold metal-dependent hydrolase